MVSQSDWLPMMMATRAGIRSILSGIQKHRPDYRIGPRFGKAWQGVRNGLSCLGESRQVFLKRPMKKKIGGIAPKASSKASNKSSNKAANKAASKASKAAKRRKRVK